MSELNNVRVRRLDGRRTRVDLETLDYYDLSAFPMGWDDPWVISEIWIDRLYIHAEFRFIAQITYVQYRSMGAGDAFAHPFAGQLVTHVRASEIQATPEVVIDDLSPKTEDCLAIVAKPSEERNRFIVDLRLKGVPLKTIVKKLKEKLKKKKDWDPISTTGGINKAVRRYLTKHPDIKPHSRNTV
jgi:hypothetical protein